MFLKFLCVILIINFDMTTAYVYCHDPNALPWIPLGYSCPVNCASIAAAVEKLKSEDYKRSIKKPQVLPNPNNTRFSSLRKKNLFYRKEYEDFCKLLHRQKMINLIYGLQDKTRSGICDVTRIIKYLRGAMVHQRLHDQLPASSITLTPRYCLNVYVPGCFCMPGYVEHNGRCLPPYACFPDTPGINEYLHRIIVQ